MLTLMTLAGVFLAMGFAVALLVLLVKLILLPFKLAFGLSRSRSRLAVGLGLLLLGLPLLLVLALPLLRAGLAGVGDAAAGAGLEPAGEFPATVCRAEETTPPRPGNHPS